MELLSEAASNASAMDVDDAASPSQRNTNRQQPTSILRQRGQPTPGGRSVTWNPSQVFTSRQQSSQPPPLMAASSTAGAATSIQPTPGQTVTWDSSKHPFTPSEEQQVTNTNVTMTNSTHRAALSTPGLMSMYVSSHPSTQQRSSQDFQPSGYATTPQVVAPLMSQQQGNDPNQNLLHRFESNASSQLPAKPCGYPGCSSTHETDKCSHPDCNEVVHRMCQHNCENRNGWKTFAVNGEQSKVYCHTHHPSRIEASRAALEAARESDVANVLVSQPVYNPNKRERDFLSDDEKMDKVYSSLDRIRASISLLTNTLEANQAVVRQTGDGGGGGGGDATELCELNCKSLSIAIANLNESHDDISTCCANTKSKKQADIAHKKTSLDDRQKEKSNAKIQQSLTSSLDPVPKLANFLNNLPDALTTPEPMIGPQLPPNGIASVVGPQLASTQENADVVMTDARRGPRLRFIACETFQGAKDGYVFLTLKPGTGYYLDVFIPSMSFKGPKDGYVFRTSSRGTGYVLDVFIASSTFQGPKDGYVFRTSNRGTGYYMDIEDNTVRTAAPPPPPPPPLAPAGSVVRGEIVVSDNITLPPLEADEKMYTPFFAINILNRESNRFDGQVGISHLRSVKQAMVDHKRVPVSVTQLSRILKRHNDPKEDYQAGVLWNQTGPPIFLPVSDLKDQFLDHQANRDSREWTLADTRNALNKAATASHASKGFAASSLKLPCDRTVQAYHSSLMSDPDITQRKGKPKDKNRDIAENSDRPMLSNLTGILESSVVISPPDEIPEKYRFKAEKAGKGLLMSRKLLAEAHNVPIDYVHFLPRGLRLNSDDMAFLYSQDGGLVPDRDPGLVLASSTVGSSNRSYNAHYTADERESKRFNGRKSRFTITLSDNGQMGKLFVQIPCSEAEMPLSTSAGVVLMEVEGLSPDANVSSSTNSTGIVAFFRKGTDNETLMFEQHTRLVVEEHVDAIRKREHMDPNKPYSRAVLSTDGGQTQLNALTTKASLERRDARNETPVKLHKCTSASTQPCDVQTGFGRTRFHMRDLSMQPEPTMNCGDGFDRAIAEFLDNGVLVFESSALTEIRGIITRAPVAINKSYSERSIIRGFTNPGWLDVETLQGPDVFNIFKTRKKNYTPQEEALWLRAIPELIRSLSKTGDTPEPLFTNLGIPEDSLDGQVYPLTSNSLHRKRFLMYAHASMRESVLALSHRASVETVQGQEQEMINRQHLLDMNDKAEKKLHQWANRSATSDRGLLADVPPLQPANDANPPDAAAIALHQRTNVLTNLKRLTKTNLKPMWQCRRFTTSAIPRGQNLDTVGKVEKVLEVLAKIDRDANYAVKKNEESLVLRVYLKLTSTLTLEVETVAVQEVQAPLVPYAYGSLQAPTSDHSFVGNETLLEQVKTCFLPSVVDNESFSPVETINTKVDSILSIVKTRLTNFQQLRLKGERSLVHHFSMVAFEANLRPLCEVILLLGIVTRTVTSGNLDRSLLPATSGRTYIPIDTLDASSSELAVLLLHDKDTAEFVSVVRVDAGIAKTLKTLEDKSKEVGSSSKLCLAYPHRSLTAHSLGMQGGKARGTFDELEKFFAIIIDPNRSDCLTKQESGVLVWSERTINRLDETKGSNETLQQRQLKLVMSMLALLINLLLEKDANLAEGCFLEPFMGGTFNLLS